MALTASDKGTIEDLLLDLLNVLLDLPYLGLQYTEGNPDRGHHYQRADCQLRRNIQVGSSRR